MSTLEATLEVEIAAEEIAASADRFREYGVPRRSPSHEVMAKWIRMPSKSAESPHAVGTPTGASQEVYAHYLSRLMQVAPSMRLAVLNAVCAESNNKDEAAVNFLNQAVSHRARSVYVMRETVRLLAKQHRFEETLAALANEELGLSDVDEKAELHLWMAMLALEVLNSPEACVAHVDMATSIWPHHFLAAMLRWRGVRGGAPAEEWIRSADMFASLDDSIAASSIVAIARLMAAQVYEAGGRAGAALECYSKASEGVSRDPLLAGGDVHRHTLLGQLRLTMRAAETPDGAKALLPILDEIEATLSARSATLGVLRKIKEAKQSISERSMAFAADKFAQLVVHAHAKDWGAFKQLVSGTSQLDAVDQAMIDIFFEYARREGAPFDVSAWNVSEPALKSAAHALTHPSERNLREEQVLINAVEKADETVHVLLFDALVEQNKAIKMLDYLDAWMRHAGQHWPADVWLLFELLTALGGDEERAQMIVKAGLENHENDVLLMLRQAETLGKQNKDELAKLWLRLARVCEGAAGGVWALLAADAHERLGKDASAHYALACELWPENISAWQARWYIGRKNANLGELSQLYKQGIESLGKASDRHRRLTAALRVKTFFLYAAWGQVSDATAALVQAQRDYPEDDGVYDLIMRNDVGSENSGDLQGIVASWLMRISKSAPPVLAKAMGEMAAYATLRQSDVALARPIFQALYDLHQDDPRLRHMLDHADQSLDRTADMSARILGDIRSAADDRERASWLWRLAFLDSRTSDDVGHASLAYKGVLEIIPGHIEALRGLERIAMSEQTWDELLNVEAQLINALHHPADMLGALRLAFQCFSGPGEERDQWLLKQTRRVEDRWYGKRRLAAELRQQDPPGSIDGYDVLARLANDARVQAAYVQRWLESVDEPSVYVIERSMEPWLSAAAGNTLASEFLAHVAELYSWDAWAARAFAQAAERSHAPKRQLELLYRSAAIYQDRLGDDARARELLSRAFAIEPVYRDVFERLNRLYAQVGLWEQQVNALQIRIEAGADPTQALRWWWQLAELHHKLGKIEAERLDYEEILKLVADDMRALVGLARVAGAQDDYVTAAHTLIQIARLERDPMILRDIFIRLATIYEQYLPNVDRAAAAYKRVLRMDPTDTEVHARMATLYQNAGRWIEAAQAYTAWIHAERHDAHTLNARLELARCLTQAGELRKAEEVLGQARSIAPTDIRVVSALAEHYRLQGEESALVVHYNRADADFVDAIARHPSDLSVWKSWISILQGHGKHTWAQHVMSVADSLQAHGVSLLAKAGRTLHPQQMQAWLNEEWLFPSPLVSVFQKIFSIAQPVFDTLLPLNLKLLEAEKFTNRKQTWAHALDTGLRLFDLDTARVWVSRKAPFVCVPFEDDPPQLVVGKLLLERTNLGEQQFLATRALAQACRGLSTALRAKSESLSFVVWTVIHTVDERLSPQGISLDWDDFERALPRVNKMLNRRQKSELKPWVAELVRNDGLNIDAWGIDASDLGTRVAALAADNLRDVWTALLRVSSSDLVLSDKQSVGPLIEHLPEAARLLRFLLSETVVQKLYEAK